MYQSIHHNIIFFLRILSHQTKPGPCILLFLSNLDPVFSSSHQTWTLYPSLFIKADPVFSFSHQTWIPYSPSLIEPGSPSHQTWTLYSPPLIKPGSRILLFSSNLIPYSPPLIKPEYRILLISSNLDPEFSSSQ